MDLFHMDMGAVADDLATRGATQLIHVTELKQEALLFEPTSGPNSDTAFFVAYEHVYDCECIPSAVVAGAVAAARLVTAQDPSRRVQAVVVTDGVIGAATDRLLDERGALGIDIVRSAEELAAKLIDLAEAPAALD